MARKASVLKNDRKRKLALKFKKLRTELRSKAIDQKLSDEERMMARKKLQGLSANNSMTRVRNRCALTGRSRGNFQKFGLCRNVFRKLALEGKIPGVTKASW